MPDPKLVKKLKYIFNYMPKELSELLESNPDLGAQMMDVIQFLEDDKRSFSQDDKLYRVAVNNAQQSETFKQIYEAVGLLNARRIDDHYFPIIESYIKRIKEDPDKATALINLCKAIGNFPLEMTDVIKFHEYAVQLSEGLESISSLLSSIGESELAFENGVELLEKIFTQYYMKNYTESDLTNLSTGIKILIEKKSSMKLVKAFIKRPFDTQRLVDLSEIVNELDDRYGCYNQLIANLLSSDVSTDAIIRVYKQLQEDGMSIHDIEPFMNYMLQNNFFEDELDQVCERLHQLNEKKISLYNNPRVMGQIIKNGLDENLLSEINMIMDELLLKESMRSDFMASVLAGSNSIESIRELVGYVKNLLGGDSSIEPWVIKICRSKACQNSNDVIDFIKTQELPDIVNSDLLNTVLTSDFSKVHQTVKLLKRMNDMGLSMEENTEIYNTVLLKIQDERGEQAVGSYLDMIEQYQIPIEMNEDLLTEMINSNYSEIEIKQMIEMLLRCKANFKQVKCVDLLLKVVSDSKPSEEIIELFNTVHLHWVDASKFPGLFSEAISVLHRGATVTDVSNLFNILKREGFEPSDASELYYVAMSSLDTMGEIESRFEVLKNLGASIKDDYDLFFAIARSGFKRNLVKCLTVLSEHGATIAEHKALFQSVLSHNIELSSIDLYLDELNKLNITIKGTPDLVKTLLETVKSNNFIEAFRKLNELGYDPVSDFYLYESVILNNVTSKDIMNGFELLESIGYSQDSNSRLFEAMISNCVQIDKFKDIIEYLVKEGFEVANDESLMLMMVNGYRQLSKRSSIFNMLCNYYYDDERSLASIPKAIIQSIFRKSEYGTEIDNCLNKLYSYLYLREPEHLRYVEAAIENPDVCAYLFGQLNKLSFDFDSHQYLLDALLFDEQSIAKSRYLSAEVMSEIALILKGERLLSKDDEGYDQQREIILKTIHEKVVASESLVLGPVMKSASTMQLEKVLKKIASANPDDIEMHFNDVLGYVLKFKDEQEVYINILLNNTDFSHIDLSYHEIEKLGELMHKIAGPSFEAVNRLDENIVSNELPSAAKQTLSYYLGNVKYKNMNRLFRGMPLTSAEDHAWVQPVHGTNSLLVNFIAGSIVNWSAAEMPRILMQQPARLQLMHLMYEKGVKIKDIKTTKSDYVNFLRSCVVDELIDENQYQQLLGSYDNLNIYFPSYEIGDRAERLDIAEREGELAVTSRRLANYMQAPSVLSVSVFKEGASEFQSKKSTRTKFETDLLRYPLINRREGEVLLPQGTHINYAENPHGGFLAKEVRSPAIKPILQHASLSALGYAYHNYLKKAYTKGDEKAIVNGVEVNRPNHAMAHTFRVMSYIDNVSNYYAKHAKDEGFKQFCSQMSEAERELLKVATAFSVTGRQNEAGAKDDLSTYLGFREACKNHFAEYIKSHPELEISEEAQERLLNVIKYMGDPAYEDPVKGKETIHANASEEERLHRIYLHRILNISHKLDLVRCYEPTDYKKAMSACSDMSNSSQEEKADYNRMVHYAVSLNKSHGNALRTDLDPSNKLVSVDLSYSSPFGLVSTNIRQLLQISESVPRPKLMETYQFDPIVPEDAPEDMKKHEPIDFEDDAKSREMIKAQKALKSQLTERKIDDDEAEKDVSHNPSVS